MPPVVIPSYTLGTLPSPGTPGSLARVTDSTRGIWMDQNTNWSQVGAGVVNAADFATLQDAVDAVPAAGGTVMLPPGTYTLSAPLNLDGRAHVSLVGMGRLRGPSVITYAGTAARMISCNTAGNLGFYNLHILHTNAGFTGHVIDFSNAFLCVVSDCYLGSTAASNAASLIYLPNAYTMVIARNNFAHCQTAIVGRLSNEHFSNAIQVLGNHFGAEIATMGIRNPAQNWLIQGNTFEQLSGGGAGAYHGGLGAINVVIDGNWFGDSNVTGTQITWLGYNLTVSNNFLTGGQTGIALGPDSAGVVITGNFIGSQTTGINLGTTAQTGVVIAGNKFEGVATPIANLAVAHQNVTITGNHPAAVSDLIRSGNITLEGTTYHRFPSDGTVAVAKFAGGLEVHVRPDAGKRGLLTFTEDTIADRWVVGTKPSDANLYFGTGNSTSNTDRVIVRSDGGVTMTGTPRFNASNTTGAGSASLGANCPAATLGAPYRWIGITTADGSTAYVPCWK
jgi:hypothetical protein